MGQTTLSFEIFPPNKESVAEKLTETLDELVGLSPDFISVTCTNKNDDLARLTVKLAGYVKNRLNVPSIAHLPAAYLDKQQVSEILNELETLGVTNLLALRGDRIEGRKPKDDFRHASDLIAYVHENFPEFHISAACYPEIHPESNSRVDDIKHLKYKTDQGVDSLITQMFFDNESFYGFKECCELADINTPIVAGIMPIVKRNQALRILKTSSATLPKKFTAILNKYQDDPESLKAAGLAYAIDQIVDLVTQGVAGIHLYTMNDAETAKYIWQATRSLFENGRKVHQV